MYLVDPLQDPRWSQLLSWHPAASVFHSCEWLEALRRTYRYHPFVITTCAPGHDLSDGIVGCPVNSWLTGRRLVSLPFSDHCDPLVSGVEPLQQLLSDLKQYAARSRYKYIEFRPLSFPLEREHGLESSGSFCFHKLDLRPAAAELFGGFHKNCVQRKIKVAERERLVYEDGHSIALVRKFYELQVITRRRQQLPPQPFAWFQNLATCMGEKAKFRVVSKDGKPIASILTLQFRGTAVYKYACSDKLFSNLGGMQLLFWRTIQDAKQDRMLELDLGRSDIDNEGLIQFKDRLGAVRSTLTYWRYLPAPASRNRRSLPLALAKRVFSHLPQAWLSAAGTLFYRHAG